MIKFIHNIYNWPSHLKNICALADFNCCFCSDNNIHFIPITVTNLFYNNYFRVCLSKRYICQV